MPAAGPRVGTVHFIEGPQQGHGFLYSYDTGYAKKARPEIDKIIRSYIGPESAKKRKR